MRLPPLVGEIIIKQATGKWGIKVLPAGVTQCFVSRQLLKSLFLVGANGLQHVFMKIERLIAHNAVTGALLGTLFWRHLIIAR